MTRIRGREGRAGLAAVEFAVVAPVLFMVVFGIVDFGRAVMALDLVNNVARQGARTGALSGKTDADITAAVDTALSNSGLPTRSSGTALTIQVNGNAATDAGLAVSDDQITVTVAVSVGQVSWLPGQWYLSRSSLLSGTVVMRRE